MGFQRKTTPADGKLRGYSGHRVYFREAPQPDIRCISVKVLP